MKVAMISLHDPNLQNEQLYWRSTTHVPISNEQRQGSQIERPKSQTRIMSLPIDQMRKTNFIRRNGDLPKNAVKSKEAKLRSIFAYQVQWS